MKRGNNMKKVSAKVIQLLLDEGATFDVSHRDSSVIVTIRDDVSGYPPPPPEIIRQDVDTKDLAPVETAVPVVRRRGGRLMRFRKSEVLRAMETKKITKAALAQKIGYRFPSTFYAIFEHKHDVLSMSVRYGSRLSEFLGVKPMSGERIADGGGNSQERQCRMFFMRSDILRSMNEKGLTVRQVSKLIGYSNQSAMGNRLAESGTVVQFTVKYGERLAKILGLVPVEQSP